MTGVVLASSELGQAPCVPPHCNVLEPAASLSQVAARHPLGNDIYALRKMRERLIPNNSLEAFQINNQLEPILVRV